MKRVRNLRWWAALLTAIVPLLVMTSFVGATSTTPTQCDTAGPKYWCTFIIYDGTTQVDNRYYKGATDGGAQQWYLYFYDDYYWNGSARILNRPHGPNDWQYQGDLSQSPWQSYSDVDAMPGSGGLVIVQLRYYECTTSCYYWTSDIMYHNLT